jgi:hypothetical protein
MVNDYNVQVGDFIRLMQAFLNGHIREEEYRRRFFDLMKMRIELHDDATDEILQRSYGDADDFDSSIRLPYTIGESELKVRVERSLAELASLGHHVSA